MQKNKKNTSSASFNTYRDVISLFREGKKEHEISIKLGVEQEKIRKIVDFFNATLILKN